MKKNYIPLHNHSHYSTLDGYATIDEYIMAAKRNNMIGIGLCDHGTASGLYKFITRTQKAGLIPVPGIEFYVAPENSEGAKHKGPIYYGENGKRAPKYDVSNGAYTHLTVFAYNNKGLENLFKLTSLSWSPEHYYFKPRIDTSMLAEYSEGLIVTTGCPSSEVSRRFLLAQDDKAYEYTSRLKSIFGDNLYVEVMNHKMKDDELERILLPKQIKLAKDLNIKIIATNDSHYAFKEDAGPHERVLALSTKSVMEEKPRHEGGKRFAFSTEEYHIKTYDEMLEIYPEEIAEEALANTIELTEKCKEISLSYDSHLRPEIEVPEGYTEATYLQKLIFDGFNKKRGHESDEIREESIKRIKEEFEVLHSNDFISYFLVVHDYIDFAHKKGIGVGAGRGCFIPDSKVQTLLYGMKSIKEIKPGDKVQTHDFKYRLVKNRFEFNVENEGMVKITMKNGDTIDSTADHLIFHEDKGYTKAEDLIVGDLLSGPKDNSSLDFEITNIEYYKYTGKVYDIQVEDVHNYTISGVTVHNSVGGSEIAYVLDISNTDPIRFDLLFERFLSPGRGSLYEIKYTTGETEEIPVSSKKEVTLDSGNTVVYVHELYPGDMVNFKDRKEIIEEIYVKVPGSAPDVDTDFHTEGREEVVQYCVDKYGKENVANIVTFGTFMARKAFKSMATIYKVPFGVANKISNSIIPTSPLKDMVDSTSSVYGQGVEFRQAIGEDEKLQEVVDMAIPLHGRISETGVHPCFVAGTLVKTQTGYKPIEKISVGEKVLTHEKTYQEVVNVMKNNSDDLFELFTANSLPIVGTGNHPMYVREIIKEKSTSKGTSGRYMLEPKWKNISELSVENDVVGIPINKNHELPNLSYDLPFEEEDFWWFIGRYVGDGWYEEFESKRNRKRKDGTPYVYTSTTRKICLSVGKEDLSRTKLLNVINSLYENRVETEHKTADKIFISPSKYPDLFSFLKMFGKYTHEKRVPEEVLNLPVKLLKSFLHGYISADGSQKSEREYGFSTVSKELLLSMVSVVNKVYKKHCAVSVEKRTRTTMIIEGRTVNVKDRYGARFTIDKRLKERSFYEDGYLWVHISKLKRIDEANENVYNLSVLDDNSYTVNNLIAHNCGVIISNQPLAGIVPLQVRQNDGKVITQWEYPELESLGLIKMDMLGLDLINTVQQTLENIKLTNESAQNNSEVREIPDMRELIQGPLDDKETYETLREGNTIGIFQLGSPGVRDLLRKAKPDKFMDIATITALYRPGPMSMNSHLEWAERNNGEKEIVSIDKDLKGSAVESILEETAGILVFQESLMQIATRYALMTPYESDLLRKAMGKKNMEMMLSLKPKFIEGAVENGSTKKLAEKVWETMEGFGSYGFNKCFLGATRVSTGDGKESVENLYKLQEETEKDIYIESMFEDGKINLHKVKKIVKSGRKPVYNVKTKSGKSIHITKEHRLLTTNGYASIEDGGLAIGKELIIDEKWSGKISNKTRETRKNNMSKLNKTESMREKSRKLMTEYQSTLNFEDRSKHQEKISKNSNRHEICLPIARRKLAELRKDPKWVAKSESYLRNRTVENGYAGKGRMVTLSDGRIVHSIGEGLAGEYLLKRGIEFELHKRVLDAKGDNPKYCDFYVDGLYFEMDGLKRGREYFVKHKYGEDIPFVYMTPENFGDVIDEAIMEHHIENGDEIIDIIEPKIGKNGKQYTNMTYDIEMETTGPANFIANGIVSHNSHSVSYAINIYQSVYLKTHYPSEFMAALIQQGFGDANKVREYIQEAQRMKLKIGPVDINNSQVQMASTGIAKDKEFDIVFGFSGVKQMNSKLAQAIVDERNKNGLFKSVGDFIVRMAKVYPLTTSPLQNLTLAGAFDSFGVSRKMTVEKSKMLIGSSSAKKVDKGVSLFSMLGPLNEISSLEESIEIHGEDYPFNELIKREADAIGMFISGHPTSRLGHISKMYNPTTISKILSSNNSGKFNVLGTITQIASKTSKAGNRSIALMIDDGTNTSTVFLPKNIVQSIEKYEELGRINRAKENGTQRVTDNPKILEILNDSSVEPLELPKVNEPFLFTLAFRGWGRLGMIDIKRLNTAHDGSLPYEFNVLNKIDFNKAIEVVRKHNDNFGSYVKINFSDGTYNILDQKVKLSLGFIMEIEAVVGKGNIITKKI